VEVAPSRGEPLWRVLRLVMGWLSLALPTREMQMRRLFAVIMSAGLLMSCGTASGDSGAEPDAGDKVNPFDVVPLRPDVGDDAEANIGGARISTGGPLQILVEGALCSVPTRLHLEESADGVVVSAFAAAIHRGPCPLDIVPWFVEVPLSAPPWLSATPQWSRQVINTPRRLLPGSRAPVVPVDLIGLHC
jgi:hypothetical protein